MDQLFLMVTVLLLSGIQGFFVSHASPQYYPCQIQSFFARMYGSGGGNLLRVHLNDRGIPTDVTFRGTCDSATLKFTNFTEKRMDISGKVVVSYRWAENEHYVLAVKQGTLVVKFAPKGDLSRKHWFILKSACQECYTGLNKLETFSKPHLYVKSDSSGFPFLEAVAGRMAWFDMNSACP